MKTLLLAAALAWAAVTPAGAAAPLEEAVRGLEKRDGFLPLHWDAAKGRLLVEIPRPGEEFLYLVSVATGIGAPVTGIDRGAPVTEMLARFDRVGPRLFLVVRNTRFRASGDEALARSVEESFPTSTLGSFEILGETGGRVVADLTPLFLSDLADVRSALRDAGQGAYQLDRERSRIHLDRTRAFPRNSEVEAALTFLSDQPGPDIRRHTPDARALTLREHHSFVQLPAPGFRPRRADPRVGFFATEFLDFASPFHRDLERRYIQRHRLDKQNPGAAPSAPVRPIVYYLDPATPQPYRTAFRAGAEWWNRAFAAAGFIDAFRVEDMPADMDPMDARYHVIQWVHRSGPGPSVGPSFVDPRTGEIIKAAVRMDSHRSLVDYDIYAAMLPAMGRDAGSVEPDAEAFVMARRRQHSAHEVGHTLGLSHNFAAAFDGRASVMAYPAPLVRMVDGKPDIADAYREGPGLWDSLMVRYAYTPFTEDAEEAGLAALLAEIEASGLRFATNPDEGLAGSWPEASVWVNGRDPVEELARMLPLRRLLVDRFDARAIRPGEAMARLGRRFTQAYLFHAHTLSAAIKAIGGLEYGYGVRGSSRAPTRVVAAARQRRALELTLDALEPEALAVPDRVIALLAPAPAGADPDDQAFRSPAGPAFDALGAARGLAALALGAVFEPGRMARLAAASQRDTTLPGPQEVVARVLARTWGKSAHGPEGALRRLVQREVIDRLGGLARHRDATPEVRAAAEWGLARVASRWLAGATGAADAEAHRGAVRREIARVLDRSVIAQPDPEPQDLPRRPWPGAADCAIENGDPSELLRPDR